MGDVIPFIRGFFLRQNGAKKYIPNCYERFCSNHFSENMLQWGKEKMRIFAFQTLTTGVYVHVLANYNVQMAHPSLRANPFPSSDASAREWRQ